MKKRPMTTESLEKLNAWKHANPERVKESTYNRLKEWRKNNPDKVKAQQDRRKEKAKKWMDNHFDHRKNRGLINKYGISLNEYNQMLIQQNYSCAICNTHQNEMKRSLAVDHNHETGKNRKLLCNKCNTAIGLLKEDIQIITSMISYLKENA
jgi:outer membrane phospholipase A